MSEARKSTKSPPSPHDALFRFAFRRRHVAAAELRHLLPRALVERIDWRTLRPAPATFVDERLKLRHGDLLFTVRLRGSKQTLVYLLLEHQSRPDRFMSFRSLRYMVRIWEALLEDQPKLRRLPIIIPIVIHHGRRPWSAPIDLEGLIDLDGIPREAIAAHVPTLRLLLDDLAAASARSLRRRQGPPLLVATLAVLAKAATSKNLARDLEPFRPALQALARAPGGVATRDTLWHYLYEVSSLEPKAISAFITSLTPGHDEDAMPTAAKQLIQQGRKEGKAEGREEGKADLVVKLLRLKFGPLPADVSARVRTASAVQVDRWVERVLTVATLDEVFARRRAPVRQARRAGRGR